MSKTVEIFGKAYKSYEMTYAEQAIAWKNNAPIAEINIGRFTLKYQYGFELGWGSGWICRNTEWTDESPEYEYFQDLIARNDTSWHEVHFIDTILEAMKITPYIPDPNNIFLQGETMTEEQELHMELAHMREQLRYALNNIDSIEKRDYVKDKLESVSFRLGELCEQTKE